MCVKQTFTLVYFCLSVRWSDCVKPLTIFSVKTKQRRRLLTLLLGFCVFVFLEELLAYGKRNNIVKCTVLQLLIGYTIGSDLAEFRSWSSEKYKLWNF